MRKRLRLVFFNVVILALTLAVLEGLSRFVLSIVYNRDHEGSLIVEDMYFNSAGLKANASGKVWGKEFHTDAFNGRKNARPQPAKKKWLFIGDSVTEGVGVDDSNTYVSLLSQQIDSLNLVNSSLIGYSIADYENVLKTRVSADSSIARVTLSLCLNDIYGDTRSNALPKMAKRNFFGSLNSAMQDIYATYKLLKLLVYQSSNSYFRYDAKFYRKDDARFMKMTESLLRCDSICKANRIAFEVLVLPYRSQLRSGNQEPQKLLSEFAKVHALTFLDALPYLYRGDEAARLYLFADEIHFSKEGHRRVAEFLIANQSSPSPPS